MELSHIKNIVDTLVGFNIADKKRKRHNVYARWIFFKLSKEHTNLTLDEIGSFINKDHATVVHGLKEINTHIKQSDILKKNYYLASNLIESCKNNEKEDLENPYFITKTKHDNLIIKLKLDHLKDIYSLKQEKEGIKIKNKIVLDFLRRGDKTINFIAETRLKPALKMLDSQVTYDDILSKRPKSIYS